MSRILTLRGKLFPAKFFSKLWAEKIINHKYISVSDLRRARQVARFTIFWKSSKWRLEVGTWNQLCYHKEIPTRQYTLSVVVCWYQIFFIMPYSEIKFLLASGLVIIVLGWLRQRWRLRFTAHAEMAWGRTTLHGSKSIVCSLPTVFLIPNTNIWSVVWFVTSNNSWCPPRWVSNYF